MSRKKVIAGVTAVASGAALITVISVAGTANAATLAWQPCDNGLPMECASVSVPMDYSAPDGEQISIAISRVKATDPARRRGVLFTNPGGPGGEGLIFPLNYVDLPIGAVYDIIGIDVRGLGAATKLTCTEPNTDDLQQGTVGTSRPADADFATIAEIARRTEAGCVTGGGAFRKHVNTPNTARDLDRIREALGEEKINYLGVSYGTWLGAVYGQMFPERLDRSVLDSSLDPTKTWQDQNDDTMASTKGNFDAWAKWTAARDSTFHLGDTAWEVRDAIDTIAAVAAQRPVAGFENQTAFDAGVGESTRYRLSWAPFAKNMGATLAEVNGKQPDPALAASNKRAADAARQLAAAEDGGVSAAVYQTVTCDWDWSTDLDSYYRDMRWWRTFFPYGGTVNTVQPNNCAFHQRDGEELPRVGRAEYAPGLVLGAEGDTQTALANSTVMARTLGSSLIRVHNDGTHGVYGPGDAPIKPNTCVNDKVNAYLVDGVLPAHRTTDCETANPPAAVPADGHGLPGSVLIPDLGELIEQILATVLPRR
ncbi:TAP-like protein [Actinokineospora alba]|uniref:TAP-like protein n=1 Tax=Actinokineospora alba TaxID=504798 RepID=A0A1H0LVB4_9PSEU|nr:alpha/beta fold hydrolase [Actinokineospora alba]TDP67473.1 TAP-like protein [Actinokineospora alba]SDI47413.1 TAP-like protein [Actinokineospora alba]SDO72132.1 TAP-like protein [Actinokineospora alba]